MSKRSYEQALTHSRIAPRPQAAHSLPTDGAQKATGGRARAEGARGGGVGYPIAENAKIGRQKGRFRVYRKIGMGGI